MTSRLRSPGFAAALGAAMLFGAGTPIAKLLLGNIDTWMLAALLYMGSVSVDALSAAAEAPVDETAP